MNLFHYYLSNMFVGLSKEQISSLSGKILRADDQLEKIKQSGKQGFFDLPFDKVGLKIIEQKAKAVQKKFKRLIVIGIGGSDLGARAIWQAVPGDKMELIFLSNPDPDTVAAVLSLPAKEWKKTAINVVSKSGSTLETMINFMTVRERLIRSVGLKNHAAHIFVTTDKGSQLESWAKKQGYDILEHPKNVGGRFSVLSVVGLFPVACGGVPVAKLLAGARTIEILEPAKFAGLQFLHYQVGKTINVLMPYSDRLACFADWYRQLWAESLGKNQLGPTPVAALGAIDQHSQIQLYNEGPNNKTITFIKVEKFGARLKVPKGMPGLEYAAGKNFSDIMHAGLEGTIGALTKNKRPSATLSIHSVSPEALGALFQFFMIATAYAGEFYGINAYNQPGVEEGKRLARLRLEKS
ncbi:MAG: glucose-6-phosphate isomerase [Patescibacteria group bacterium]|jgi:glucose-6-phosphate isomerase